MDKNHTKMTKEELIVLLFKNQKSFIEIAKYFRDNDREYFNTVIAPIIKEINEDPDKFKSSYSIRVNDLEKNISVKPEFKMLTKSNLRFLYGDHFSNFSEFYEYHRRNNPEYFNSIVLPFYFEQKSEGKIPIQFIQSIASKDYNTVLSTNFENNQFNEYKQDRTSEQVVDQKPSSDELMKIAYINYEHFKTLANNYIKQDPEYYLNYIVPIMQLIEKRKKRIDEEAEEEEKDEKTKKIKTIIIFSVLVLALIASLVAVNFIFKNESPNNLTDKKTTNNKSSNTSPTNLNNKIVGDKKNVLNYEVKENKEETKGLKDVQQKLTSENRKKLEKQRINELKKKIDKVDPLGKELIVSSVIYRLYREADQQFKYDLNYNTLSKDLPKKLAEYNKFVDNEYVKVTEEFALNVSKYAETFGPDALYDLAIEYGFRHLLKRRY